MPSLDKLADTPPLSDDLVLALTQFVLAKNILRDEPPLPDVSDDEWALFEFHERLAYWRGARLGCCLFGLCDVAKPFAEFFERMDREPVERRRHRETIVKLLGLRAMTTEEA